MKILLLAIFQGLLLEILSQESKCLTKGQQVLFYIYNANVEVETYTCIFSFGDYFPCENYNMVNVPNFDKRWQDCNSKSNELYPYLAKSVLKSLCKLKTHAELLKNTLKINTDFNYSKGNFDHLVIQSLFWTPDYSKLQFINKQYFDIWTIADDRKMYINNENITLTLTEEITYWKYKVWKTSCEGIIVSQHNIPTSNSKNLTQSYHTTLLQDCGIITQAKVASISDCFKKSTETALKPLYVYTCPTSVNVNFCLVNSSASCEELGFGKSVNDAIFSSQCVFNFFNTHMSICTYPNSRITVCRKAYEINLKNDTVENISSNCKYSDGLCRSVKAFWKYDKCNFQKLNRNYKKKKVHGKSVIVFNSTELILEEEGKINGEEVWFTNNQSLVVSEIKLQFHLDYDLHLMKKLQLCVQHLNSIVSEQKREIINFQSLSLYLMFAAILCVLWYIFNSTVNFYSLWKHGKSRTSKNYAYLMNCVSQSLTNRHMYFQDKSSENNELSKLPSQTYESVENELYNKPC